MRFGGFDPAELEIRARRGGGRRLRGRFPYKRTAVLSDGGRAGGRPVKEQFAPAAFAYRLQRPDEDIHLLYGHDYSKPLASRATKTLVFADSPEALQFEAEITAQIADTSHGRDAIALIEAGLSVGISPGFRIPPPRAVPADEAEKITQEAYDPARGMHGATIRTILAALLYELSVVTAPAYKDATVEPDDGEDIDDNIDERAAARAWTRAERSALVVPRPNALARWRP